MLNFEDYLKLEVVLWSGNGTGVSFCVFVTSCAHYTADRVSVCTKWWILAWMLNKCLNSQMQQTLNNLRDDNELELQLRAELKGLFAVKI